MTRTDARAALRSTTPMTFYKMGRRGLTLFALLLIMATQPTQAFVNFAGAAGYGAGQLPPSAPVKTKHWWEAFHAKETSAAGKIAQNGVALGTAMATGSGTATTAVVLGQLTQTAYGQYLLMMTVISFLVSSILSYGVARMARQTAKEQLAFQEKQLAHHTQMMQMMLNAQMRNRAPLLANRIARPAIMAAN